MLKPTVRLSLRVLCRSHDRAKKNFDLHFLLVAIRNLHNLIESFLPNGFSSLFKSAVLAFDRRPADRPLTFLIALDAGFKRSIEEHECGRNLIFPGQIKQFLPRLECQRRRINHAEAICHHPLFHNEVDNRKSLGVKALVTLVVANVRTRPIRRNDLGRPEMQLGKGGFSASRGATQHHD